jgi:hypothetical protein
MLTYADVCSDLAESVGTVDKLLADISQLKMAHSMKLAEIGRRVDEDMHFLVQERMLTYAVMLTYADVC